MQIGWFLVLINGPIAPTAVTLIIADIIYKNPSLVEDKCYLHWSAEEVNEDNGLWAVNMYDECREGEHTDTYQIYEHDEEGAITEDPWRYCIRAAQSLFADIMQRMGIDFDSFDMSEYNDREFAAECLRMIDGLSSK